MQFAYEMEASIRRKAAEAGLSISEDAIDELIILGTGAMHQVLCSVEKVSTQLSEAIEIEQKPLIVTHDLVKPLWDWKACLPPLKSAYKLRAAGDGNCLLTSLRMGIDLRSSTEFSMECLDGGWNGDELDVEPCLSGDIGSPNHLENFVLRKLLVNWFLNPISNLNLEMEGTITYEDGKEIKSRPMTRADVVVLETRFHTDGDIDMSPNPDAIQKRNEIAEKYMRKMYRNGECGSTPMLIAFVNLSKVPCGVRIYQKQDNKLKIYADVCSPSYTNLPPEDEDDIFEIGSGAHIDTEANDEDVWMEDESETESEDDEVMEETIIPDQNFIRLLFSSPASSHAAGHYDLLATSFQKNIITSVFPNTRNEFSDI